MSKLLVVIPLFNKEQTIERTVSSIFNQDYSDFELLIVNDGCTDLSVPIIEKLEDTRINIIHQKNKGVSAARNSGIQHAIKHEFDIIAFIDGDDFWHSAHLSTITKLFYNNPTAAVAATNYQTKKTSNSLIENKFSGLPAHHSGIIKDFFEKNHLNSILSSSSFALKIEALKNISWYNECYTHGEDTDFFIRLALNFPVAFSTTKTVVIDKSISNRSDKVAIKNRSVFDIDAYENENAIGLKKYLDLNRFFISIAARMEGNIKDALFYQQKIDLNNLNTKQRKLLNMSALQLKALYKTKKALELVGLNLRTG